VANAPGGFKGAFTSALGKVVSVLEGDFSNPVTINISAGWGEANNRHDLFPTNKPGGAASFGAVTSGYNYSQITTALAEILPATDFTSGGTFAIPVAQAQAIGLLDNNSIPIDGWIGFGTADPWSFNGSGTPSGAEDFIGFAEHEITEVM